MDKTELLCDILGCGSLDVDYLCNLLDKNPIEFDVVDCLQGASNRFEQGVINLLIYEVLVAIIEHFCTEYETEIVAILGLPVGSSLWDDYRVEHDLYEIYVNYIDSHICFDNGIIQELFYEKGYWV